MVELELVGQLGERGQLVGVEVLLLERDVTADPRARLADQVGGLGPRLVVGARRLDEDDALALEPPGDDLRRDVVHDLVVVAVHLVGGAIERPQALVVLLELPQPVLQLVDERPAQRRGADHEAERQRQEDRDDGDDVVSEIDHVNNPVSQ